MLPLLLAGCVPVLRVVVPDIDGRVTDGPSPVAGAEVRVVQGMSTTCEPPSSVARTDERGAFRLSSARHAGMAMMGGEEVVTWTLCVRAGERTRVGASYFGHGGPARPLHFVCDLRRLPERQDAGICIEAN